MTHLDDLYNMVDMLAQDPAVSGVGPDVRASALETLIATGEEAIDPLIEALESPYIAYISRALIGIGAASVDPLITALFDVDPTRRMNAAYVLGKMRAEDAIGPLLDALQDEDQEVRSQAAAALGNFRDAAIVLPLCAALDDPARDVRRAAAVALGNQSDERALDPLNDLFMRDPDERVHRAAQDALRMLGHAPPDPNHVFDGDAAAHEALSGEREHHTLGIPRIALLIATLESGEPHVQRRASRELVRQGYKAVPTLINALGSEANPVVRAHIAWVLGEIGDLQACEALERTLDDPDDDVRYTAHQALGKLRE